MVCANTFEADTFTYLPTYSIGPLPEICKWQKLTER